MIFAAVLALSVALVSTSCSGTKKSGVEVTFTNSNRADVTLRDCPRSICEGSVKLQGCRNPACPEPTLGDVPSGMGMGWNETRALPYRYHLVLNAEPLDCPPAVGPPKSGPTPDDYAVNYDITPSGRCIIVSYSHLSP